MEKNFKPVPNVDCLKYKGTSEKPDIKIFVSHRIDLDSETIDNPLYIPVRCGATFDERSEEEIGGMLGDDTGDNISEKRKSFCELTVLYWAWKNVEADYYGLCHYRRYLSFSNTIYSENLNENQCGLVVSNSFQKANESFRLCEEKTMREQISKYDIVTIRTFDEQAVSHKTIYEMMKNDFVHYDISVVDSLIALISSKYPSIYPYALEYFEQSRCRLYNLFVMKKDIFYSFCDFEFNILGSLETSIDLTFANFEKQRLLGYLGEHLWSIYVHYLLSTTKTTILELQGVFFKNVVPVRDIKPAFNKRNVATVFSSSEGFVPYMGVAIKSLLDCSKKENNYDIIVLEKSISDFQKERLSSLVEGYSNVSLRFVNISHMVNDVKFFLANNKELSEETYYTVLVPWVLKNYDKALVLDCDIIINRDIADLYFDDISKYYIAAAKEIIYLGFLNSPLINVNDSLRNYTVEKLGVKKPFDYFQAGVLLINAKKFREKFNLEELLDEINNNNFNIVEQDLLNKICYNHVKILDYSWNFMSCISDLTCSHLSLAPEIEYNKWKEASKNPYIYHYITGNKPWRYPNLQYADKWWKVARTTPFYETAISSIRSEAIPTLENAIYDLQRAVGFFETRSPAKKALDTKYPIGSKKRKILDAFCPYGSRRWKMAKKLYYFFHPSQKP